MLVQWEAVSCEELPVSPWPEETMKAISKDLAVTLLVLPTTL